MRARHIFTPLFACAAGLFVFTGCAPSEGGAGGAGGTPPLSLTSTADSIDLHYEVKNLTVDPVIRDEKTYNQIKLPRSVALSKSGFAALPFVTVNLQIPPEHNVRVDVVDPGDYEEQVLKDPPLPSRGTIYRNENPDEIPYVIAAESLTSDWYPGPLTVSSSPFVMRDARGISIHLYPVQYRASDRTLRIYKNLHIKVTLSGEPPTNALFAVQEGPRLVSPAMDDVYRSVFANYNAKNFVGEELKVGEYGKILVIHTSRDVDAIQPYVMWKRQKGFQVTLLEVAKGTNVKTAIRNAYENDRDILYVQLVGGWDDLKSDIGPQSAPTDPALGTVSGDDHLPDLIIGRFAAGSSEQVAIQVAKAIAYEKDPVMDASFYTTALGLASGEGQDMGDDGEADYDHMEVIRSHKLLPYTYKKVYQAYKDPTKASVAQDIDQGVGLINYTGHGSERSWVTSGYGVNDVKASKNGAKLPFIISVACVNGAFHKKSGTLAEAFLNQKNGGAVASLMSTINQPWQPPMRGQDYMNDVLIQGYEYGGKNPGKGINVYGGRTSFGSIVLNGMVLMYTEASAQEDLDTLQTWTLFGDAALEVRTAEPRAVSLTGRQIPSAGPFVTEITTEDGKQPLAGARVTISQGEESVTGVTSADGRVSLEHGFTEGNAVLTVSGYNLKTLVEKVPVI